MFLLFAAVLAVPAAAQSLDTDSETATGTQGTPESPLPRSRYSLDLPETLDPDDPFLGFFEGSESMMPRPRASTPADLPKISTISPMAMEPEPGEFPKEVRLGDKAWVPRNWQPQIFTWEASHLHHQPLYFEDLALERDGHSFGILQPVVSIGLFKAQVITLPYHLLVKPPCGCEYTLGYYRPGDDTPRLFYRILKKRDHKHRSRIKGRRARGKHYHVVHPTPYELEAEKPTEDTVEGEPSLIEPIDLEIESSSSSLDQEEEAELRPQSGGV